MSSFQRFENKGSSGGGLRLPKPDPANITVLTSNLPNKPILPWTHFDSPWLEDNEANDTEEPNQSTVNS